MGLKGKVAPPGIEPRDSGFCRQDVVAHWQSTGGSSQKPWVRFPEMLLFLLSPCLVLSDSIDIAIIAIVNYYRDSDTALGPVTIVGLDTVELQTNPYLKVPKLNVTDIGTISS